MQKLNLDMIYADMSEPIASSVGSDLNIKSLYTVEILGTCLEWLSNNLSSNTYLNKFNNKQMKEELIDYLWKNVPKPISNSWIDTVTFNVLFNWALSKIVRFVVSKVFELIFVGDSLELNSKYPQNNPENIV